MKPEIGAHGKFIITFDGNRVALAIHQCDSENVHLSPYIPQPVFFFVPSQLVSSPLEPPPPVLIPPLPPAARSKFAIKSLVTVIASQSCRVRDAVRPA